jgi:hypothetical protein
MRYACIGQCIASSAATRTSNKLLRKHWTREKKAPAGECVLLSQDAARFLLVPTWSTPLGVQSCRSLVGPEENKDQVCCFAALNVVMEQLTTRLREPPTRSKATLGQSTQQRLQTAFVAPLQEMARL